MVGARGISALSGTMPLSSTSNSAPVGTLLGLKAS
jgi:hypothetical protein